jgi:prevent-host-death family protein
MRRAARVANEEVVSLRDAKANLSGLTKQARDGMRVVITNHGTPIADLVSHGASATPMRKLKRPGPLPKLIKLQGGGPTAAELVLMDRAG